MKRSPFISFTSRAPSRHTSGGAVERRRRTHYQVLGVDAEAQPFLIEAAYRALMRRMHPDKGGDTAQAQLINEAFRVLRDPESRARYDQTLPPPVAIVPAPQPAAPAPLRVAAVSRGDDVVSNAYVLLGVLLVVAALLSAHASFAEAREPVLAALNPQPFWQAPSGDVARLRLVFRKMRV